ncbi:MAG TPA: tRNA epoxyqueuosine(34) reductase QueG [Ferrovibrio sp.]|uniref:tRNA epoxyqueuosine(34) reductase QueG n=1 Tax=Ferrovibrio sp. TaxID=1917215 RepID=UPI002B4ACC98|nr:tRNA epoxyqueuosine(34) reductase QueG [Ferrovibrio sp.]HLT77923.1 tRNA epoxyqueuosine(34) reductase QueG [Ferrovibrio sp.]
MPLFPTEIRRTEQQTAARIRERAAEEGFDAVGITRADRIGPELAARLDEFMALGRHGEMRWLEEKAERRRHPNALWPEAKSIIALGLNYGPAKNPLDVLAQRDRAAISVYAQGRDYHLVVKKKLKSLAGWMHREWGNDVKVFVDTAPLMEKPLSAAAGIGWQGKHTNLVSRDYGSWLFLGAILTTLELPADEPEADHCGSCSACLEICPTRAFPAPYQLDARRCISYLTIEYGGVIAPELAEAMGNRIYGCDDCLAICPWNKFASLSREITFHARPELDAPALLELARLDDASFRALFGTNAVKRIGRDRFIRNVCIALGNSGMPEAAPALQTLCNDSSEVVRAQAALALETLNRNADGRDRSGHDT